jgi:hypothetical protein
MEIPQQTPCIAILNKQKCLFFKNREQEGKTGPGWGFGTSGKRDDIRKGCRRVNRVEIYTHVCKPKKSGEGRLRRMMEG